MDIKEQLGPKLTSGTALLLPNDSEFDTVGKRWNCRFPMSFSAIIDATSELDVSNTIKFANENNIPFIAFNGTHGAQLPLLEFKDGIGITTLKMKSLSINTDDGGKTAQIKGSWISGNLRDELYKLGKRTTLGACDSTGIFGPMLGGGHGFLQGRYGLLADQVVEMRVVLADGSIVSVSEEVNKELFWAMRGAGHNFGIVTELRYKVYDVPADDTWTHTKMVFKGEKLAELTKVFDTMTGEKQPVELALWFPQIMRIPDIDSQNPIILIQSIYEGSADDNPLLAPLQAIGPLVSESKIVPWITASDAIGWGWSSFSNQKGLMSILRFPVGVQKFKFTSMKEVYDHFSTTTANQPEFAYSFVVWESYATQGVKVVPDEATAVADRDDNVLAALMVIYRPLLELDAEAERFGKDIREILVKEVEQNELHAYVNYANGDESLEEIYGHQPWRLERLRGLKQKYDPDNRFGFYSPII